MGMVAIGSCLFTELGAYVAGHQDPTRIAAQVVTGIGFLGAGAILRHGTNVQGLTTASTVWVVAAVGMCAGFGAYLLAFGGTTVVLLALLCFRPIERRLFKQHLVAPREPELPEL
jgi:putative Mg2+ transporter-C (MgtC) family protein